MKALQAQVAQIQQELDNESSTYVEQFPPMLAGDGNYYLDTIYMVACGEYHKADGEDQNIFPDEATAQGYADAFKVMLELRRCEGAGHYYDDCGEFRGVSFDSEAGVSNFSQEYSEMFAFFPPFPTEELAQAALLKVGKDRIIAAARFLANTQGVNK